MGKIISYIAMSLNGKIAKLDGSVAWLEEIPNPDKSDFGYYAFYNKIGTTIMGYKTYEQVIGWDIPFPYPDKNNYVITRRTELEDTEHVHFIKADHIKFLTALKEKEEKNLWLIGGGGVNTLLLNAQLIDEIIVHTMPVILPDGIDLFTGLPKETKLELMHSKTYRGGVMEMSYRIKY